MVEGGSVQFLSVEFLAKAIRRKKADLPGTRHHEFQSQLRLLTVADSVLSENSAELPAPSTHAPTISFVPALGSREIPLAVHAARIDLPAFFGPLITGEWRRLTG